MLKAGDVVEMAKISSLHNLAVARNEQALLKFLYLGLSELYSRFNLSIKVESVETNPDLALYELRSKDVSLIINLFNSKGQELRQTDVLGGDYDYKFLNWRSFLLKYPKTDLVFAVYKATPPMINTVDDELAIPDAMVDALLCYIGYIGHSTINKDNINESSAYDKRFELACQRLEMQGYKLPLSMESVSLRERGYV